MKNSPVILRQTLDPEALMDAIRNAELEPLQLDSRPAESRMARVLCPGICLDITEIGPAMHFTGVMPMACHTLVFAMDFPELGHSFNFGINHPSGYLGLFPPGGLLDAMVPAGSKVATLTLSEAEFEAALERHFPGIPVKVKERGAGMKVGDAEQARLCRLVRAIEAEIWQAEGEDSPRCGQSLEDLVEAFMGALRSGCEDLVPPPKWRMAERHRKLRDARDYIAEHCGEPLVLDDLCQAIGLSPRGVENLFRDLLGITPNAYLRHRRLHQAHKALRQGGVEPGTVKRCALEYGFRHMGHFSHEYRALFGECPSETLAGGKFASV